MDFIEHQGSQGVKCWSASKQSGGSGAACGLQQNCTVPYYSRIHTKHIVSTTTYLQIEGAANAHVCMCAVSATCVHVFLGD